MSSRIKKSPRRRGNAAFELVIVLPLVTFLIGGAGAFLLYTPSATVFDLLLSLFLSVWGVALLGYMALGGQASHAPTSGLDQGRSTARPKPGQERRGAVAVEMAFLAPILLLMVLGMVEFGRAMMLHQVLTNCAREGAREAILPGATDTTVQQKVQSYMATAGLNSPSHSISPSLAASPSPNRGDPITVTVSVNYSDVSWGIVSWLDESTLSASVVMRKE